MGRMGYRVSRKLAKEVVRASNRASKQREKVMNQEKDRRGMEAAYQMYLDRISRLQGFHKKDSVVIEWDMVLTLKNKKEVEYRKRVEEYVTPVFYKCIGKGDQHRNKAFNQYKKESLLTYSEVTKGSVDKDRSRNIDCLNELVEGVLQGKHVQMLDFYRLIEKDKEQKYGISQWDYHFEGDIFYIRGYYHQRDFPERKLIRLDSGKVGNRKMKISDRNKLIRNHIRSASIWKCKTAFSILPIDLVVIEVLVQDGGEENIVSRLKLDRGRFNELIAYLNSGELLENLTVFKDDFRVGRGFKPINEYSM